MKDSVFNHYLRITPTPPSEFEPPSQIDPSHSIVNASSSSSSVYASSSRSQSPQIPPVSNQSLTTSSSTSSSSSSTRKKDNVSNRDRSDPSTAGSELDDGLIRRDATRAVGGDGEGADPTLTHDLLSSRSREGQWGELI